MSWEDRAACRNMETIVFFPLTLAGRPGSDRPYAKAKLVCARCDVQDECLAVAVAEDFQVGMWGGLTPSERRRAATTYTATSGYLAAMRRLGR